MYSTFQIIAALGIILYCYCCLIDVNPRYILRNYMAEKAIQMSAGGNFTEVW